MPIDIPVISHNTDGPPVGSSDGRRVRPRALSLPGTSIGVSTLFAENRLKILTTYGLFVVENLLRLAQPFALGWAINDLLADRFFGVGVLVVQHVLHLIVGLIRKVFDTRAFSSIYSDLATRMIVSQQAAGVDISRVTARASLSREFVDFFEHSVPMLIRSGFSVLGSLIMLAWYDWIIVASSLGLLIPAAVLSRVYSRWTQRLSRGFHNELEREVDVIDSQDGVQVRNHFDEVALWRIRLSDAEAINFGLMECFILAAIVAVLFRACALPDAAAGDIFAVFRYLMLLLMGLDALPRMIQQVSRLRDVSSRVVSPQPD